MDHLIAIDLETSGLTQNDEIVSAVIGEEHDKKYSDNFYYLDRFGSRQTEQGLEFRERLFKTVFNPSFTGVVIFHNALFDIPFLWRRYRRGERFNRHSLCRIHDSMSLSRLSRNNKFKGHTDALGRTCHSLKYLSEELLGQKHASYTLATRGQSIRVSNLDDLKTYNKLDVSTTLKVYRALRDGMSASELIYFDNVESPHLLNLLHLKIGGVPFDFQSAKALHSEIQSHLARTAAHIYLNIGEKFNLDSCAELARAVFQNPQLKHRYMLEGYTLQAPNETITGEISVDSETFSRLIRLVEKSDGPKTLVDLLKSILRYGELSKSLSKIEGLMGYACFTPSGYRLYPEIKASTASGRITVSKPPILGLSENIITRNRDFDTSSIPHLPSARNLIRARKNASILSIDISGLDIGVVAALSSPQISSGGWRRFFIEHCGKFADPHYATLRVAAPELFTHSFKYFQSHLSRPIAAYLPTKILKDESGEEIICFIPNEPGEVESVSLNLIANSQRIKENLRIVRDTAKQINLGITYLMGPTSLAKKLNETGPRYFGEAEARELLNKFYTAYPEVRLLQDQTANSIFQKGYVTCPFGRKFYSETWDELNLAEAKNPRTLFEFILKIKDRHWVLGFSDWIRQERNPVGNMAYLDSTFSLRFKSIEYMVPLPRHLFQTRSREEKKGRSLLKKSEDRLSDDDLSLSLTTLQLSQEVDCILRSSPYIDQEASAHIREWWENGLFSVPENSIKWYRCRDSAPASRYFKKFTPLLRASKKFFPLYCQGVAATVAKRILSQASQRIESETEASILMFIHDSIEVECEESDRIKVALILQEAISMDHSDFNFCVRFSGELKDKGSSFS